MDIKKERIQDSEPWFNWNIQNSGHLVRLTSKPALHSALFSEILKIAFNLVPHARRDIHSPLNDISRRPVLILCIS